MDYQLLTKLTRDMLDNSVPTRDAIDANIREAIHFWGNDFESWLLTEGEPPLHFKGPETTVSFSLIKNGVGAYQEFIECIGTDDMVKKYIGDKSVEKFLGDMLRGYFAAAKGLTDTEIAEFLKEKISELKGSVMEWEGFAPTAYLLFEDFDDLVIGKTEFTTGPKSADIFTKEIADRINQNASGEAEKEALKTMMEAQVSPQLRLSPVCGKVVVKAESSKVWTLVEEEIETSLDLLRCYSSVLFPWNLRMGIGLIHQCGYYFRPVIGFSKSDPSWTVDAKNVGIEQQFVLTQERLNYLKKNFAFDRLCEIIGKEHHQRTKLEKLILTTVRWLGRGVIESDYAKKILHFAAASENLIMGQKSEGEITEKFSRRVAFLIGSTPQERRYFTARSKQLYAQRSKVIHSGNISIEPADVHGLETITLRALVEMAKRSAEWTSHQDFIDWFEDEIAGVSDAQK